MEEDFLGFDLLKKFPELVHGISDRSFGDMKFKGGKEKGILNNRLSFFKSLDIDIKNVVVPRQVHGNTIAIVGLNEKGRGAFTNNDSIPATDALITKDKGVFLMVQTADCLPVLVYDPINQVIGIIHAGWRGIIDQIIPKVIEKFKDLGSQSENLIVGIGPSICQRHFTVKKDVLHLFKEDYPKATFIINNDGYIDLKKAVISDFEKLGVDKSNIELSELCTVCNNGFFGSFRKEGNRAPQMAAVIGMRGK